MFNWFGRKSAPARVGVPWFHTESESGFARGADGVRVRNRTTGETMVRRDGAWETGVLRAREVRVGEHKVLGEQQPPIMVPASGSVVDLEARSAIADIVASLQAHGLIGG